MEPIRRNSRVRLSVPLLASGGGGGAISDAQVAVLPREDTTDDDFHPVESVSADNVVTFLVGPGTSIGVLSPGRNWIFVRFTDGSTRPEIPAGYVDVEPGDDTVATGTVVTAAQVARSLGLGDPLDDQAREVIEDAIEDATADVEAYLGQTIRPQTYVEHGLSSFGTTWEVTHQPVLSVTSAVPETDLDGTPNGLYTVTYVAGLDAATDPAMAPVRRYIRAHAMNSPGVLRLWRTVQPDAARVVTSVSVEGQSTSFGAASLGGGGEAGSGAPGALPVLKSLSYWKVAGRRAYQAPTVGGGYGGRPWRY